MAQGVQEDVCFFFSDFFFKLCFLSRLALAGNRLSSKLKSKSCHYWSVQSEQLYFIGRGRRRHGEVERYLGSDR